MASVGQKEDLRLLFIESQVIAEVGKLRSYFHPCCEFGFSRRCAVEV